MFREAPSQLILLSIIAHLRGELHINLELKAGYLLEAIEVVDQTDHQVCRIFTPKLQMSEINAIVVMQVRLSEVLAVSPF